MTTVQAVGATSNEAKDWNAIDWPTIRRNVRRLQVRIAQATKEGRWGKVRALQRLLTHSYSGKLLAVRRVTENKGKKTPGVDQEIWDTPEKKTEATHELQRRGYQPQPLRRVYPTGRPVKSFGGKNPAVNLIRYADDFIITSKSKEVLEREVKPLVEEFLRLGDHPKAAIEGHLKTGHRR